MIYQKIARTWTALLAGAVLLSGCSVKTGTNNAPRPNDAVAHASSESGGAEIIYSEFSQRYAFSLMEYGVEDDEEETVAAACKQLRDNIINNLIIEKIFLKKAGEYGVDTLSEAELNAVTKQYEEQLAVYDERYGAEEFDSMLESCGLKRDDLLGWLTAYTVEMHVTDKIVEQVDYSEAEASINEFIDKAKQLYSEDPDSYREGEYYELWLPDGARMIQHIVIGFDDEVRQQIKELREAGDDGAADALRLEKAQELYNGKAGECIEALSSGEDYLTVLLKYADNAAIASLYPDGMLVLPNDPGYDADFVEKVFSGLEESGETCGYPNDNGVDILKYKADAKITEDDLKTLIDGVFATLKEDAFDSTVAEWLDTFNYEIDYEKLRLDPPA